RLVFILPLVRGRAAEGGRGSLTRHVELGNTPFSRLGNHCPTIEQYSRAGSLSRYSPEIVCRVLSTENSRTRNGLLRKSPAPCPLAEPFSPICCPEVRNPHRYQ